MVYFMRVVFHNGVDEHCWFFYVGQVWDPFTLESLRQLDNNGSNQAITAMTALPGPSTMIVTATNEAMLRSGNCSIL